MYLPIVIISEMIHTVAEDDFAHLAKVSACVRHLMFFFNVLLLSSPQISIVMFQFVIVLFKLAAALLQALDLRVQRLDLRTVRLRLQIEQLLLAVGGVCAQIVQIH